MVDLPPWVTEMPVAEQQFVIDTFRAACLSGSATFKVGEVTKITRTEVDGKIRWYFSGAKAEDKIYRLNLSRPVYLVTADAKPGGYYYSKMCLIIARDMPLFPTWEKILKVNFTAQQKHDMIGDPSRASIEFPIPEEHKKLHIRQLPDQYISFQMSTMSEAETRDWRTSRSIRRSPISKAEK
ncbi:MAG TPA: hypothetical protein VL405_02080 [Sphingomonas sp.]|jgi:hypothetical protein|nr:hypothetical protein [Sphingomonas sp.]